MPDHRQGARWEEEVWSAAAFAAGAVMDAQGRLASLSSILVIYSKISFMSFLAGGWYDRNSMYIKVSRCHKWRRGGGGCCVEVFLVFSIVVLRKASEIARER